MNETQQTGHMVFKDEKFHFIFKNKIYSWNYLESLYDKDTKIDVQHSQENVKN